MRKPARLGKKLKTRAKKKVNTNLNGTCSAIILDWEKELRTVAAESYLDRIWNIQ